MHICPELNDFLLSFDTLEVLAVKQCWPSLEAIVHHSNLKKLTFHATENRERKRHLLDLEDLEFLDRMCTGLEFLEIDIRREDEWPVNIIAVLARGFANLRELRFHVGLDIHRGNIEPTLTKITANEFVEVLLCHRLSTSKLKRVILKTGENLRDFRDVKPRYAREEEDCAAEFEIRAPHDGIGEWVVEERTIE
ncbi:uncharacterized protein N7498_002613 [Penicillium cinerascens]|uniref:F-box domain-containing protein n=1 Tax=Penicillium cinerascens TaxID=70096 RepID=A0A9W9NAD0_9EURO|nr:uncharacterized protein N7498_002613 [Penicillium cinerascens]KAJ5216206.1 hypothetical protein N7498_002613 [Penicillium cinerascens]